MPDDINAAPEESNFTTLSTQTPNLKTPSAQTSSLHALNLHPSSAHVTNSQTSSVQTPCRSTSHPISAAKTDQDSSDSSTNATLREDLHATLHKSSAPGPARRPAKKPWQRCNKWLHYAVVNGERGMSTAEYAVGTIAACAFAALLFKIVSSPEVQEMLTALIDRALNTTKE
ncbi:DUF4244 domain-containing protein [Nonomuraea solani]